MLYDEVCIVRHGEDHVVKSDFVTTPEVIDLPARYADQNNVRVRRFLNCRAARLSKYATAQTTDTISAVPNPVR